VDDITVPCPHSPGEIKESQYFNCCWGGRGGRVEDGCIMVGGIGMMVVMMIMAVTTTTTLLIILQVLMRGHKGTHGVLSKPSPSPVPLKNNHKKAAKKHVIKFFMPCPNAKENATIKNVKPIATPRLDPF